MVPCTHNALSDMACPLTENLSVKWWWERLVRERTYCIIYGGTEAAKQQIMRAKRPCAMVIKLGGGEGVKPP